MNQFLAYFSVVVFSIFIGSQVTEGVLLVPYWQSLSTNEFYTYYEKIGPSIGQFYTILTIIAALIPFGYSIYYRIIRSKGFTLALGSSFFALLFVACFYVYFKSANEMFFAATLSDENLVKELVKWSYWHWGRILLEMISLVLLILSMIKSQSR